MEKHLRLACGIPWSSEFIWTRATRTLLNLRHPDGCEVKFFFPYGDGWSSARRHNSVLEQGKMWNADLICILGADQTYPEDMLEKLVRHHRNGCDVVAAMVPIRGHVPGQGTKPFQPIAWRHKPNENGNVMMIGDRSKTEFITRDMGDLVEIHGCGSGVLMFPTSALESIAAPWFTEIPVGPTFERKACTDWPFVNRLMGDAELHIWCDTTIKVKHIQPFEIDDTFADRFPDWEKDGDPSCCDNSRHETRILQVQVSPSIPFYDEKFRTRYGLLKYESAFRPSFFFGCYSREDLKVILNHQSTAVMIWAGSDAAIMRRQLEKLGKHPFGPNVKHIAISKFIADDLDAIGISYVRLPLCNVDERFFAPASRRNRNAVYCYLPSSDPEKYGASIIEQVRAKLPAKFDWIMVDGLTRPTREMAEAYERCFIGIRPTLHDGLSNTAVELGLMGRRIIWNGNTPNAIPWETADDIVESIVREHESVDDSDMVATLTSDFIDVGELWKDTHFYGPATPFPDKPMRTMTPELADKPYEYETYFDMRYSQGALGAGGPDPEGAEAEWTRNEIIRLLNAHGAASVTEVGCGSCARWPDLPRADYIGLDVSAKGIEHAKEKFPNATFFHRNAVVDEIPAADAVICLDVMQHITRYDFPLLIAKLHDAARRVLIVKTSINIPQLHYQFPHDWSRLGADETIEVPNVPVSRIFVFTKAMVPK